MLMNDGQSFTLSRTPLLGQRSKHPHTPPATTSSLLCRSQRAQRDFYRVSQQKLTVGNPCFHNDKVQQPVDEPPLGIDEFYGIFPDDGLHAS